VSIRLRALLLGLHDLRPIKQEPVRFEVQDAKGPRVFRKELRSNAFGVVSPSFELADDAGVVQPGRHKVELRSEGKANAMYQVVGRYYQPWSGPVVKQAEPISIKLRYDRTRLRVDDVLTANVDVAYHLQRPTFMVIVDLGIPPGFTVQQEDLAELVKRQVITRFSTTGRQITLYVGVMRKERPLHLRMSGHDSVTMNTLRGSATA